jgi:RNA polymerase sigma-70 factor, ECF subfamily
MNLITAARETVKSIPADAEDRDLAARLARGEPKAFDDLVEQYGRRVIGLAARLLNSSEGAQDAAQDVFLAVLAKGAKFRGEARLWTYLAAVTVNRCRSIRRRRWLHERVLRKIAQGGPGESTSNRALVHNDTAEVVRREVARLPAGYREVIVLKFLEEMSVRDVAEVLGLRVNTVEVRLSRARKMLEQSLGHLADDV